MRKPFEMATLLARIETLLLNAEWQPEAAIIQRKLPAAPARATIS
jgi:DNA-binding response OmpR family regulator